MSKNTTRRSLRIALLALIVTAGAQRPLAAQGVTYVTVSKPEMAGAMGMVARFAPGAMDETRVTTTMQGPFVRTDEADETSTIMDMAEGRYTFLDHGEKSFYSLTLEEMMAQAAMGAAAISPESGSGPELQVERTGKTQRFDGYTAEQVLMFMEQQPAPEGATPEEEAGSMAFLVELWVSRDFPGHEAFMKAQETMAERAGATGIAEALAGDAAMMEASQRITEQMKGLEGVPVRTVTSFVMVPPGTTLDRDAIMEMAEEPLSSQSMAGAAAGGARDAARQALGGLMGRRRQPQPAEEAPAAAGPSIFMRLTQVVEDVRVATIPDDRFQVPAGYREAPPVR